jgi:hypothetical protein
MVPPNSLASIGTGLTPNGCGFCLPSAISGSLVILEAMRRN